MLLAATFFASYIAPFFQVIGGIMTLIGFFKLMQTVLQRFYLPKLDYWDPAEVAEYRRYYIATKCQDISPSNYAELGQNIGLANRINLVTFFLNDAFISRPSQNKYYIILGDSGMGKTTFMVNLFLRYRRRWSLFKRKIVLIPFGRNETDYDIQNKVARNEQANTILLLDGLDEDQEAMNDYAARISQLLKWTEKFHKVVISCRIQLFPNQGEEPYETGMVKLSGARLPHYFVKKYIAPFSDADVERFIRMKISFLKTGLRARARKIIKVCPDLMVRPMLLSYIETLVTVKSELQTQLAIYQELVTQWIIRESNRYSGRNRESVQQQLFEFSSQIAGFIYEKQRQYLSSKEMEEFAQTFGISLSLMEMKSKSLLNRDSQGQYKFSHKSILEYFLACNLVAQKQAYCDFSFSGYDQCKKFYSQKYYELYTEQYIAQVLRERDEYSAAQRRNFDEEMRKEGAPPTQFVEVPVEYSVNNVRFAKDSMNYYHTAKFRNAHTIKMRNYRINDIRPFEAIESLKHLDLSKNEIETIDFLCMLNLEYLDLSDNKLVQIERLDLPAITTIVLKNSYKLKSLKAFYPLKTLKEFHISKALALKEEYKEELREVAWQTGCQVISGTKDSWGEGPDSTTRFPHFRPFNP